MGDFFTWLETNWFSLVQSAGIVGSILLTALMLRRDRRGRRISDLLTLVVSTNSNEAIFMRPFDSNSSKGRRAFCDGAAILLLGTPQTQGG